MFVRFSLYSFAVASVLLAVALPADAQVRNNRGPGAAMQKVKTVGTVMAAGPSQVQVATSGTQPVLVMLGPNTQVSVTGTAEQDYLKSGVNVEFVAEVAKDRTTTGKIEHLTIFTPTTDRTAGLSPPEIGADVKKSDKGDKADKDDKAKPGHDPGIGDAAAGAHKPQKNVDPLTGNDLLTGKPAKSRTTAPQFPGTFTVRGVLRSCKDGKISVAAGRTLVKGELTADATIDVDMSDLHAVQRDDKITVNGYTNQARPNMVYAESVSIELANPLTGKKHGAKSKTPPASHAKAAGDQDAAPAAGK